MFILETERLILREFILADAPLVLELVNDPAWLQFIGDRGVRTLTDARTYLHDGPMSSYKQFGFGLYLVQLKAGDAPLGMCGLIKRPSLSDVDIGFAFLPQFRGHGYAFEAATAVLNFAETELELERIVAITAVANARSIKLLEKLGLHYEKTVRLAPDEPEIKLFAFDILR